MTVLQRLAKKNLVSSIRDDRAHRYAPVHGRDELVAGLMVDALDQASDTGSRQAALVHFVERVGADEADALRRALAELEANHRNSPVGWRADARLRDTDSVSALAFTILAVLLVGPVPALLARATWPLRAPRAAMVLWQADRRRRRAVGIQRRHRDRQPAVRARPGRPADRQPSAREIAELGWPLWLAYVAVFALTAADRRPAGGRRRAGRHRHPAAAGASPDAGRPARRRTRCRGRTGLHPRPRPARAGRAAAAGLLPARRAQPRRGQRGHAGLASTDDEVAAILSHERAHLRARHDLVLEAFTAVHAAFPRFVRSASALDAVQLLVELLADDAAVRAAGRTPLARALVACASGRAPSGALAAGGPSTVLRVRRLSGRRQQPRAVGGRLPAPRRRCWWCPPSRWRCRGSPSCSGCSPC